MERVQFALTEIQAALADHVSSIVGCKRARCVRATVAPAELYHATS